MAIMMAASNRQTAPRPRPPSRAAAPSARDIVLRRNRSWLRRAAATRLTALIWVGALAAPLWFAMLMIAIFASAPPIVKPLLFAGLTVMTVFWTFWATWWPGVRYRYISYRTDVDGFTIRRGVLWRGVTSIPKARVQHTDVVQGPIQRRFGLSKLVVHTAGTQDASVSLSGLPYDKALPIRDFLIESDERDGV